MKSPMPVMEQLWKTREAVYMDKVRQPGATRDEIFVDKHKIDEMLTSATFFNTQVAWDTFRSSSIWKDRRITFEQIGPQRLPYPTMWMEWQTTPEELWRQEIDSPEELELMQPVDWAMVLTEYPRNHIDNISKGNVESLMKPEATHRVKMSLFQRYPTVNTFVSLSDAVGLIDVDESGRVLGDLMVGSESEDVLNELRMGCVLASHALSLINCKNVTTDDKHRITFSRSGTEKRRGIPARKVKYHTIVLPGGGSTWETKTGRHRAAALHRVRGHFKTFTEDRPLLGKHTGTYWWGWQVRGNADNGIVVSDYEMGEKQ